jgi:hypothetical protein
MVMLEKVTNRARYDDCGRGERELCQLEFAVFDRIVIK